MRQKVKDVMPVFETQVDITVVEEDGSYFFYMDHEIIEEVNIRGKITMWYFIENVCHSFDISKSDLVGNKYKISKKTVEHEKYPINTPFPVYRSFQRPPIDY